MSTTLKHIADLTEERQQLLLRVFAPGLDVVPAKTGQLEGAGLGLVPSQIAGALEVGEVGVDGRRRGEPDALADLAHRRRVAVPVHVLDEEVPDLLLPAGQRGHEGIRLQGRFANMCSTTA